MKSSSASGIRWVVLGFFVLQLSWIVALPPFGGVDEFDHVYRADAVAHGEWVSEPEAATRGTGATVSVSRGIVEAARPECQRLGYTRDEDCVGVPNGDRVEIASGAGRYNPLFYIAVGYPTAFLDGVAALYGMRLVSALLCVGLLSAVLMSLRQWAPPRVVAAVVAGLTPMVIYSTSVVAPNGLEMVAGLGLWVALAGLAHNQPDSERRHLVLAACCGVLLLMLRSLGPLWALLILVTSLVAWPGLAGRVRQLMRVRSGRSVLVIAVVTGLVSVSWTLVQRSLVIGLEADPEPVSLGFRLARSAQEIPLWLLQSIAAFPKRDQPAPLFVYPCYLIVLGFLLVVGLRWAESRVRRALLVTVALSFVIPFAITVATLVTFGTSWQGRYTLPYLLGAALLAGAGWARRAGDYGPRLIVPASALLLLSHAAGVISVARQETRESPLSGSDLWALQLPWLVLAIVVVAGAVMLIFPTARMYGAPLPAVPRRAGALSEDAS